MSVASIEGAKTSYILFGDKIIYFEESTDRVSEEKNFVKELLGSKTELEIEYVVIPGSGIEADYMGIDVKGKIALIRRGTTTFEEKANVAESKGAAGIIVYNNVSGDIKMNVGDTTIAVASIRQDDGEMLAAMFNIGFDPLEEIPLVIDRKVESVWVLDPNGVRRACEFTQVGEKLTVHTPLEAVTVKVLFMK